MTFLAHNNVILSAAKNLVQILNFTPFRSGRQCICFNASICNSERSEESYKGSSLYYVSFRMTDNYLEVFSVSVYLVLNLYMVR
jgi:hypothetical protein